MPLNLRASASLTEEVVNDDGPPSRVSPYFQPFIDALQAAGHTTVVVIPNQALSWIGKAHAVGKTLTAWEVCLDGFREPDLAASQCGEACPGHKWILLDGSPASCTQIGLYHCGYSPHDFDLVISGPNHGLNASTIYDLSSGTVGGALEGALCGMKSISLSFASKEVQPKETIQHTCQVAVLLIDRLNREWKEGVELYNVNIPMVSEIEQKRVVFTVPSNLYWTKSSLFTAQLTGKTKQYRWCPEFSDIKRGITDSVAGEDLWALANGHIRFVITLNVGETTNK